MTYEWPDNFDDTIDIRAAKRCVDKFTDDKDVDQEYISKLRDFLKECEEYMEDYPDGVAINDDYFVRYAMELAEDIGALKGSEQWPLNCIDWDEAASMLKTDYTEVEFDGATFWVR